MLSYHLVLLVQWRQETPYFIILSCLCDVFVGAFHDGCLLGPASEGQRCVSGVEKEEAEVFGSRCMESNPIGDLVVGLEGKKPKDF